MVSLVRIGARAVAGEAIDRRAAAQAERFALWAADYDRWGLGPEAEIMRLKYRQAVIRGLREGAWRLPPSRGPDAREVGAGRA